jgi:hypothetical protein
VPRRKRPTRQEANVNGTHVDDSALKRGGQIYPDGDGFLLYRHTYESPRRWTNIKGRLAFFFVPTGTKCILISVASQRIFGFPLPSRTKRAARFVLDYALFAVLDLLNLSIVREQAAAMIERYLLHKDMKWEEERHD